ncbi:MAG: IS4 family transposase [Planctomycetes bacterium]|nr:IS4 family transposase [Planctomycetota bacterium]
MGAPKRDDVCEKDIVGLKYFDKILSMLDVLRDVGTERDRAGNRNLHMDEYCALILLYLFNPIVTSLRAMQQASELKNVQKKLACSRSSLGSLSESVAVFDPKRIKPIIEELGRKLQPINRNDLFKDVSGKKMTLVDGSIVKVLPWLSQAMLQKSSDKNTIRMHTFFEVDKYVPSDIVVTGASGRGEDDERAVTEKHLEANRVYVMDRGYAKFTLFNAIVVKESSYVCRIRDNSRYGVETSRELTSEDVDAGVLSDEIVCIGEGRNKGERPDHPIRIVTVLTTPHPRRGGKRKSDQTGGPPSDGKLRIATDMLDPPAHVISEIYRRRWQIETFFRFLKHLLGCRHLISTQQNGIEIQLYMAIIACMLISLWTGRKPTKRTYEMVCHFFTGWASEEELLAHIEKLQPNEG